MSKRKKTLIAVIIGIDALFIIAAAAFLLYINIDKPKTAQKEQKEEALTEAAKKEERQSAKAKTEKKEKQPLETAPAKEEKRPPVEDKAAKEYDAWKQAYIDLIEGLEEEYGASTVKYDLIYLDKDNIPELVADTSGGISIYAYDNGQLYTLADGLVYGVMGHNGYQYIERGNIVYEYAVNLTVGVDAEAYWIYNDNHEAAYLYCYTEYESSEDGDYYIDGGEPKPIKTYYYYNEQEITREEYANYAPDVIGEPPWLGGSMLADEAADKIIEW